MFPWAIRGLQCHLLINLRATIYCCKLFFLLLRTQDCRHSISRYILPMCRIISMISNYINLYTEIIIPAIKFLNFQKILLIILKISHFFPERASSMDCKDPCSCSSTQFCEQPNRKHSLCPKGWRKITNCCALC